MARMGIDQHDQTVSESDPAGLTPAEHASLRWTHNRTCTSQRIRLSIQVSLKAKTIYDVRPKDGLIPRRKEYRQRLGQTQLSPLLRLYRAKGAGVKSRRTFS